MRPASLVLMTTMPRLDEVPPVALPPGENPFRVKGLVARGFAEFVSDRVNGGMDAVVAELRDPAMRAFFQQTFLTGSWYDFLAFLNLMVTAAKVAGRPTTRFIAEHAAWQAYRDIHSVHRLLLLIASPETVAPRMGVAFSRYFDFGRIEVLGVQTGTLDIMVRAMPAMLVDWYKVSVQAAAEKILGTAGAKNVQSWYEPAEPDGKMGSAPLVRFRARRTWSR